MGDQRFEDMVEPSPYSYAKHLASYVTCPSSIYAHCVREFGRDKAPPLTAIARMRLNAAQARRATIAETATLVPAPKPAPPPPPKVETATILHGNFSLPGKLRGSDLLRSIASDFGVTGLEMKGAGRARTLVHARAVFIKLMRDRGASFPKIGHLLGDRDHSTIIHSDESFPVYCKRDDRVRASYERHRDAAA